jgi:hypothetical protein
MVARFVAAALVLVLGSAIAPAQQPLPPTPLYPGAVPRPFEAQPLPPLAPGAEIPRPPDQAAPVSPVPPADTTSAGAPPTSASLSEPRERVFCEQPVTVEIANPEAVATPFRPFIGIWSDASWTPQLCAALVVQNVAQDGTATILYAFGPMGSNTRGPGGVLHGTGIIREGELKFENSDGSQFAFRALYADLDGRLTTSAGQSYQAVFKKTP